MFEMVSLSTMSGNIPKTNLMNYIIPVHIKCGTAHGLSHQILVVFLFLEKLR